MYGTTGHQYGQDIRQGLPAVAVNHSGGYSWKNDSFCESLFTHNETVLNSCRLWCCLYIRIGLCVCACVCVCVLIQWLWGEVVC